MTNFSADEWNKRHLTVIIAREVQKFSEMYSGQVNFASTAAQRELTANIVEAVIIEEPHLPVDS